MTRDVMNSYLTRIFTVALLLMISMGAKAEINVEIGEFTGGKITASQGDEKNGEVEVTLTVAPDDGYTISKKDIEVYATISPNGTRADDPQVSGTLELKGDDPKDLSEKRDYTVTVKSNFGIWVKVANFTNDGSKGGGGEPTRSTGYSGVYYIASNGNAYQAGTTTDLSYTYDSDSPSTNFYLRPAADPQIAAETDAFFDGTGRTKPFLTSNYTGHTDVALWLLKKTNISYTITTPSSGVDYYYTIQHVETGKYLVCDPYFSGNLGDKNDSRRKSMHLETKSWDSTIPDKALFKIRYTSDESTGTDNFDSYCFIPKVVENKSYKYLNLADRNQPVNYGTKSGQYYGGLAGLYTFKSGNIVDDNSRFKFEQYVVAQPTITFNNAANEVTITATEGSIYYTTHGDTPTSELTAYSSPVTFTQTTPCTITAIAVKSWNSGVEVSSVEATYNLQKVATPTFSLNTSTNEVAITSTEGASIYYSIGTENTPAVGVNPYTSSFEFPYAQSNQPLKAIATKDGWINSDLGQQTITLSCPMPTISFNSNTQMVTLTCADAEATMYYTTNGDTPDPGQSGTTEYTGTPFGVPSGGTVKAIATHTPNYNTSDMAELSFAQVATPTIQNNGSNAISITCATEGATIYYTTDGSTPTTESTLYTTPLMENVSNVTIKAIAVKANMITSEVGSGSITLQCESPVIVRSGNNGFTVSCPFPTSGVTIYYTTNGSTPTTSSSSVASGGTVTVELPITVMAMAVATNYDNSTVTTTIVTQGMGGDGSAADPYTIEYQSDVVDFITTANTVDGASKYYKVIAVKPLDFSSAASITQAFSGTFDGGLQTISNLNHSLFNTIDGGTVKNVILDNVSISGGTNAGAICNEASGATRIYNCGVLSTGTTGSSVSGSGHVGSIVGSISGNTRVINCYSYANVKGGTYTAGIVGYNPVGTTQANVNEAGMVMNCMFYGDITGSGISPVYGGEMIDNAGETGINNYNYYRRNRYDRENNTYVDDVSFDNSLSIDDYHRSWPADAKYLTRFEYYRSILNSNKRLCTYWITGKVYGSENAPTEADEAMIAKWVLDPSIAPYPILKRWGKYPSVINQDPDKRINPSTKAWVDRVDASDHWGKDMAPDTEGQKLGTVMVTINNGRTPSSSKTPEDGYVITAMDTKHDDYCYGKIQLPYYNEIFGNPDGDTWEKKYGGNYTDKVVTGWDVSDGSAATDYNFADRNSYSGRVFAQGGYFYVPKGVTSITITAHWADAVYLCNKEYSLDRVNVASGVAEAQKSAAAKVAKYGSSFTPAGTISNTFQGQTVYTTIQEAIGALNTSGNGKDVYNQAIVLIGNVQVRNHSYVVGLTGTNAKPFTIMSADLDFDNEPDNCLELQFRNDIDRPGVQPIRFDFLPVPELGLAMRTNKLAYSIGLMIPLGHFEITETAFMHTTQFEYDGDTKGSWKSSVIINGGEHEMFTKRKQSSDASQRDRTSYFLLGGNAWVHRFAPGAHPNTGDKPDIYLFPVNVIGGQIKELYLTGLYRPELPVSGNTPSTIGGAPRCYIDGGKFDIIAGAGYDKVSPGENVTFIINHSLIGEFYGGGINASNPISGNIHVTINNSYVNKYCGGPMVGDMTDKTITTNATGTTFGLFYGGGNGGNSYYRQLQRDGDMVSTHIGTWIGDWKWDIFNPLGVYDDGTDNKGYHAEYEFEVFNQSNGLTDDITQRGFIKWVQFGITTTGDVNSTLENCKVLNNFYGGGNLASVSGDVTSALTNTTVNGSVFGAGYSAAIPTFQVHDKDGKTFPTINDAGVITEGHIPYTSTEYKWTNDLYGLSEANRKASPTYQKEGDPQWYCYTWNSLENLGVVTGAVTLTITGDSKIGTEGDSTTGNVYGGGDASAVINTTNPANASTTVNISGNTLVRGNVFGGGNEGIVSGTATVNIGVVNSNNNSGD